MEYKVSDLRTGMNRVDIEGVVTDLSEPRVVNLRRGGTARVMDCTFQDDTGSITLTLWEENIDKVKEGSKIRVENGYVSSFRGEPRLNVGRYGRLKVLE
ncbi:MAG: DNA-binding protein [Thaumarchaeota archaeon]|nr:DNA-binding protein [Nitrososphaerota archaeon]